MMNYDGTDVLLMISSEILQAYAIAGGQHSVSVAAHRSEFQETALHYGGGMSAVIVLQSLVMVGQLGLDGYGVYEAIRLHRSGMSYVCGNLLPVFWVMFSLHIIQNCCNLVKFRKGDFVAKRSGLNMIEQSFDSLTIAVKQLFHW